MPLLGPQEKGELEKLIFDQLAAHYDQHGPDALLRPGVGVVVRASGPAVVTAVANEAPTSLAAVETRSLFTALCHLAADGTHALPRDSLPALATEATSAAAAQINRIAPS